jgi:uncharacterized protein YgbK (DUF1537 family)
MPPLLGCIADDFTGATDLANMLVRGGMRTVQCLDIEGVDDLSGHEDAIVVALKSRSARPDEAVASSLDALSALRHAGAERFFFKYCSTFDSTADGNIGPVAEALMSALGVAQTVFCPAFPENERTVYLGHLFVGNRPLHESGMRNHPLTPMTDANIVRVLAEQSSQQVGLLPYPTVDAGSESIIEKLQDLRQAGQTLIIADVLSDTHLSALADALGDAMLVTGGSAIALYMAQTYRQRGLLEGEKYTPLLPSVDGASAIVAGSCSEATRRQVAAYAALRPSLSIDPIQISSAGNVVQEALAWAEENLSDGPVLIYSTAAPAAVRAVHERIGRAAASALVERALADIAGGLVACGVRRLVVAGGETAGAVLRTLGVRALRIGPQIDPGVPWTESIGPQRLALALKSGNFGSDNFFQRALEMLM